MYTWLSKTALQARASMPPLPGAHIKITQWERYSPSNPCSFWKKTSICIHTLNCRVITDYKNQKKKKKSPTWENVHILYICQIFIADIFLKNFNYLQGTKGFKFTEF